MNTALIRHMPDNTLTISIYRDGECIAEKSGITSEDFALRYCIFHGAVTITHI